MEYVYIPPPKFSFFIRLNIQAEQTPLVHTLFFEFDNVPLYLPFLSTHFPDINQALDNYFLKKSTHLYIPHLLICKTPFQQKVVTALTKIPFGGSLTYGDLASRIDTHPRAIGQALK